MNERVKSVLNIIVEKFKSGEIPEAVAMATFLFRTPQRPVVFYQPHADVSLWYC